MDKWRYSLHTPPKTPTQNVESRVGYDMDTEIENGQGAEPLFIQYKRSEHMVGNARYSEHFPGSYYRFKISNSNQHNILVQTSEYYPHTYYVAPLFHKNEEYIDYHRNEALIENSRFATCSGLPSMNENNDSDRHTIGFTQDQTLFFTEPTEVKSYQGISDIFSQMAESNESFSQFEELRESFSELIFDLNEELGLQLSTPEENISPFDWIRDQQRQFAMIGINVCFAVSADEQPTVIYWKGWD
jgi:hypothetical protein